MPLLLIFALSATCIRVHWPRPVIGGGENTAATLTAVSIAISILIAARLRTWVVDTLDRAPGRRLEVGRVYGRFRRRLFYANLGLVAMCILVFGWGWLTQQLLVVDWNGRPRLAPFAELAAPLPYFVLLVSAWVIYYDAERALHRTTLFGPADKAYWSRGGYFLNHLRQFLLMVMLPVLLFVAQQTAIEYIPRVVQTDWYRGGSFVFMFLIFLLLPLAVKPLLGLRPLPPGPIRDQLAVLARRLHFRCTDFLLWPTHGVAANAMIVGLLPRVRYVIFTDRILEDLPPDELDAVLGHEIGHAKHGHIWYYAIFFALSIVTMAAGLLALDQYLDAEGVVAPEWVGEWIGLLPLALAVGYLFVVWGFLSRRCERQADVYGCRAVSCTDPTCLGHDRATAYPERAAGLCPTGIRTLISALQRVEYANGVPGPDEEPTTFLGVVVHGMVKWLKAWQHSTMDRRITFLRGLIENPRREKSFQRSVAALRWGLLLALTATLAALGQVVGWRELCKVM